MKLKVLILTETAIGGVGKHVLDLSEGLVKRGHSVHLMYSPLRSDETFLAGLAAIASDNLHVIPITLRRSPNPRDLGAALRIRSYLRRHGPFDVAHGHSSKGGALVRMAGFGVVKALVYTPHAFITSNPEIGRASKAVYGIIERGFSLFTSQLIAVSEEERAHAVSIGIAPHSVEVIENGIDLSLCNRFPDRRIELEIPKDALVIGTVGRLSPQKDPGNLLSAFAIVATRYPSAFLALVGDGPLRAELEEQARGLGLADRIRFLGMRNGPDFMTSFDVFALSSRYEGMAYVLIEAAASGLPIVSTAVAGVMSLVTEDVNGHIVPVEDAKALGAALGKVLESAETRRRFAEESRRLATGFSLEAMVGKTEALYFRLVAGKSRGADDRS